MKQAFSAILAVTTSAACATGASYATGRPTLNSYSLEEEVELGTRLATVLIATAESNGRRVDPDDELTRVVWRVAGRLLAVPENRARMPPIPWEVHVIDADIPNAWCFPGGNLLVSSGLLRSGMARDEDELAALLGHEMGHAAARHGTERLSLKALHDALGPLGRFFGPRLVDLTHPHTPLRVQAQLAQGALTHDAVQEVEADLLGLEMMARAGFDPGKAAAIWARRAAAPFEPSDDAHPASEERARVLRDHLETARYVASRRASWLPPRDPPWAWREPLLHARTATRSLSGDAPLPRGPRLRSPQVAAPPELLAVELRVLASPEGGALRAAVSAAVGRDLREDRLPFAGELVITRATLSNDEVPRAVGAPLVRASLGEGLLDAAVIRARVALPALPPGRYVARARITVGALEAKARRVFSVGSPEVRPREQP